MANKNSIYVQSLVSFINDTKPYHSKLTEIVEEYRFSDQMSVKIVDNVYTQLTTKSAWAYSHFADGVSSPAPLTKIHQVVSPLFRGITANNQPDVNRGEFMAGRDENTLLPLVPYAYDPTSIDGSGLADSVVQRKGNPSSAEPLLEGHDVFLSHGAYVFRIWQTKWEGTTNKYDPLISEIRNEGVIAKSTSEAQKTLTDKTNPESAINQIQRILDAIAEKNLQSPLQSVADALADLQTVLDAGNLPQSYDSLFTALIDGNVSVIDDFSSWDSVQSTLEELSPSIYFGHYSDLGLREGAAVRYSDVLDRNDAKVTAISVDVSRETYDELSIEFTSRTEFLVYGSHSGLIGGGVFPGVFSASGVTFNVQPAFSKEYTAGETYPIVETLSFSDTNLFIEGPAIQTSPNTIEVTGPGVVRFGASLLGKKIRVSPTAKITVHENAPKEVWSLIKVNPMAYSRPRLKSTRYGYVSNTSGERDAITILDDTFPSGTVVLSCVGANRFTVTTTGSSSYSSVAEVGVPFNDGRLAFTITNGTAYQFTEGDKFFIEVLNESPRAIDLDLYYGYDMDPYDGDAAYIYDAVNGYLATLDFNFDSRFVAYDTSSFGLQIGQGAAALRWRLRALPNFSRPLAQRPPADNRVDQTQPQEPGENLVPVYDRDGNATPDIRLYYADEFSLEYYGADGTWKPVSNVGVGNSYSSAIHGISFTLVPATKPFISAVVTHSDGTEYRGGDIIAWEVENKPPVQLSPASLSSIRTPRLIIHGDSFYDSIDATWTLEWQSQGVYTLQGLYTTGAQANLPVFAQPKVIYLSNGLSYKDAENSLHWTVQLGSIGLSFGDSFTFTTYSRKPSILVHGSVSGWQSPAVVDEYYWNGKIGFKIKKPSSSVFEFGRFTQNVNGDMEWNQLHEGYVPSQGEEGGIWVQQGNASDGFLNIQVTYLRDDVTDGVYRLRSHVDGHWTLYKNGKAIDTGTNSVGDKYIKVSTPTDVVAGTVVLINVLADDHQMTIGHDLAIVKSTAGRMPAAGDFVAFKRARYDDIAFSVKAKDSSHQQQLSALGQVAIDPRFIDPNISAIHGTSQETAVLSGWIPSILTIYDGTNSLAEFSDSGVSLVARAAATGETIGTVLSLGDGNVESIYFRWDSAFAAKYLPLNAEATIVTYSSGMNDRVKVNMSENLVFLLSGGGLSSSSLFEDKVNVVISEDPFFNITMNYANDISAVIADTGFTGFLPGYDNLKYDEEDGADGYYDAGLPLLSHFEDAKFLKQKENTGEVLTDVEQKRLQAYKLLIGEIADDPTEMTVEDFVDALLIASPERPIIDHLVNRTPTLLGFGIPDVGLGIQIEQQLPVGSQPDEVAKDRETSKTKIVDSMILSSNEFGYTFDQNGYGVGEFDKSPDTTVIVIPGGLPPLPSGGLPAAGTAYADFDSGVTVDAVGRVIEVSFSGTVNGTPQFYVWQSDSASPIIIPVVERLSNRLFRFYLHRPAEFKLIVT